MMEGGGVHRHKPIGMCPPPVIIDLNSDNHDHYCAFCLTVVIALHTRSASSGKTALSVACPFCALHHSYGWNVVTEFLDQTINYRSHFNGESLKTCIAKLLGEVRNLEFLEQTFQTLLHKRLRLHA